MLKVRTEVKPSGIHGLGLFLTHPVKALTVVWEFHPKIDRRYSPAFLNTIPAGVAEQIRKYSYVNPDYPEVLVLCGDDARFMNFPSGGLLANTALGQKRNDEFTLISITDIAAGEELTVPLESDADAERKLSTSFQSK